MPTLLRRAKPYSYFPFDDSEITDSFITIFTQPISELVLAVGVVSSGNVMLWHLVQIDRQHDRTECVSVFSSMALRGLLSPFLTLLVSLLAFI